MPKHELNVAAVDALAEAWASIDGKLDKYIEDRDTEGGAPKGWRESGENPWGYYQGYQVEAEEIIRRLAKRKFKLVPIPSEDIF